ncbi:MAG UNVERIFIED_CONTAM: methyltransferase domain-containing protein [Planctomycetaceae bacterium]
MNSDFLRIPEPSGPESDLLRSAASLPQLSPELRHRVLSSCNRQIVVGRTIRTAQQFAVACCSVAGVAILIWLILPGSYSPARHASETSSTDSVLPTSVLPVSNGLNLPTPPGSPGNMAATTATPAPPAPNSPKSLAPPEPAAAPRLHQPPLRHSPDEAPMPMSQSPRPRYQIPDPSVSLTDELIMQHITRGSRVIDLGCGDGRLMQRLHLELHCDVLGVEVEQENLLRVIQRGLAAIQANLDQGLSDIPNNSFDFAVLSQTLQQVRNPRQLLTEMLRVATRGLVVVPNFGHWRVRMEVLRRGRTPGHRSSPLRMVRNPKRPLHVHVRLPRTDRTHRLSYRPGKPHHSRPRRGSPQSCQPAQTAAFYLIERAPVDQPPKN